MKVLTILTNGFEEIEALGTIDILRRAGITVDVYSLHEETLTAAHNIKITDLKNIHFHVMPSIFWYLGVKLTKKYHTMKQEI